MASNFKTCAQKSDSKGVGVEVYFVVRFDFMQIIGKWRKARQGKPEKGKPNGKESQGKAREEEK